MCLTKTSSKLKTTKDIVCYKVLRRCKDKFIHSLVHRDYTWEMGKLCENKERGCSYYNSSIEKGYYHSYETLGDARSAVSYINHSTDDILICECIIPKGTYCYRGYHLFGLFGYASKKIIINKITETYVPDYFKEKTPKFDIW